MMTPDSRRLKAILTNSGDLVFILDRNFTLIEYYSNDEQDLLMPASLFMGKKITEISFPDHVLKNILEGIEYRLLTYQKTVVEYDLDLANGKNWFSLSISTFIDEFDHQEYIICSARNITYYKTIQKELEKTQIDYKDVVKSVPIGIYKYAKLPSGEVKFLYASDRWCEMNDLTQRELSQNPEIVFNTFHPEDINAFLAANQNAIQEEKDFLWEGRKIIKGKVYYVHIESKASKFEDGSVIWNGIENDISELRKTEIALKEQEYYYRTMFEVSLNGMVYQDATGGIIDANPAATEILGLSLDQMQGRTSLDPRWKAIKIDGSDFAGQDHPAMQALVTGKKVQNVTMGVFHPKENDYRWLNVHAIPVFRQGKENASHVYVTFEDRTERIQAEKALSKEKVLLRTIIDNIPINIYVKDLKSRKILANKAEYEYLGAKSESELIGKDDFELYPSESAKISVAEDQNVMQNEESIISLETENTTFEGKKSHFLVSKIPLKDECKEIIGLVGISIDITKQKNAEKILKENQERLREAQRISKVGSWEFDLKNNYLHWSKEHYRIFEIEEPQPQEVLYALYRSKIYPEDLIILDKLIENTYRTGEGFHYEHRVDLGNGRTKYILGIGKVTFDQDGNPAFLKGTAQDITEQKLLANDLKAKTWELENYFEMSLDMLCIADMQGVFVKLNKAWETFLGYEIHELENQPFMQFIHDQDIGKTIDAMKTLADGEPLIHFSNRYQCKNGTYKHLEWRALPINGVIYAAARDISERKKVQAELKYAKEMLEQSNRLAKIGSWKIDLETQKMYWSDSLKQIFGYSKDFDENSIEFQLYRGKSEEILKKAHQECVENGISYDIEIPMITAQEKEIWTRIIGQAEFENGKCKRVFGATQDISKQKNEESRLKLLESVITHTTDAVLITEAEPFGMPGPKIIYVNEAFTKMTGYTSEEVIGKTPRILQGAKSDRKVLDKLRKSLENWEICNVELINYKKNGKEFWVNLSIVPVADSTGWFTHWIAIERDVTEQKKASLQLKRLNKNLKTRTKQAESANRAKSDFLANMSHEIRTPLNGVIGFTDLLMRTKLDENQKQYMDTVFVSANSLMDLINDILDFSKIEAGKFDLNIEKIDLISLAEQAADLIKYKAHEKGLELLLNISPNLPRFIWADEIRLRQILVNMLSNAVKFTHEGEIEIKIEALKSENDQMNFIFSVRDTGVGIAPENQEKIFQAFLQEDISTTRKYGGTGLGLTISNKLLALMGTKMQLESELGKGSCFFFNYTCKAEYATEELWTNSNQIQKILIVDDNRTNRIILQEMLALKQIKTEMATNGIEALEMIAKNRNYDLIIMDYHMPYMDGLEVVRKIRKELNLTAEQQPIIFLHSSSDDDRIKKTCDELDVLIRMVKPVKITQLFSSIDKIKFSSFEKIEKKELEIQEKPVIDDTKKIHILVVDDYRINMILTKAILKKISPNYQVTEATNGKEAVDFFKKFDFDLAFMDIQMPEMNGYDAAREIRKNGVKTPIIALTAGTVAGEAVRCLEAGMNDYLAKPVVESVIRACLEKWLFKINP